MPWGSQPPRTRRSAPGSHGLPARTGSAAGAPAGIDLALLEITPAAGQEPIVGVAYGVRGFLTVRKDALPDAKEWEGKPDKLGLLER